MGSLIYIYIYCLPTLLPPPPVKVGGRSSSSARVAASYRYDGLYLVKDARMRGEEAEERGEEEGEEGEESPNRHRLRGETSSYPVPFWTFLLERCPTKPRPDGDDDDGDVKSSCGSSGGHCYNKICLKELRRSISESRAAFAVGQIPPGHP